MSINFDTSIFARTYILYRYVVWSKMRLVVDEEVGRYLNKSVQ